MNWHLFFIYLYTFSACALLHGRVEAQTSERPFGENFRERCRTLVSGAFANSWNEASRAREAVTLSERSLKKLRPIDDKNNRELQDLNKKLKDEKYDPSLLQRRDYLVGQIKLFHDQIEVQQDLLNEAKKSREKSETYHKKISDKVNEIFKVTFVDDPEGSPRKIFHQLAWKTDCPKFRTLCPLPPKEAATLKSLIPDIADNDQDCARYASQK